MVLIEYDIPLGQVEAEIQAQQRRIETGLSGAIDDLLKFIEQGQILAYTGSGNPPLPAGSDYQRTFTLQSASRTERTGEFSGRWYVDEGIAPYGQEVLGPQADQAAIHRGRWKTVEDVERETAAAAERIIQEYMR